ncbi:MAG: hypothetical protein IT330_10850 [Anaerolineae bacterium]|nr:hypothetical protein [Anaerolineae bacterium]
MNGLRPLRRHLAILGLYLVLTLILTYPLVTRFATHVPGSDTWAYDEYTFIWNTWYFKRALIDLLSNPLHTNLIYYPLGIDLVLHTYNLFNALVALPLQLAFGLIAASNATLVLATTLSGYGTYLLVRYLITHLSPPPTPSSPLTRVGISIRERLLEYLYPSPPAPLPQAGEGSWPKPSPLRGEGRVRGDQTLAVGHSQKYPPPTPSSPPPGERRGKGGEERFGASSALEWAAIVAGLLYAFASNRAIYAALGHYDMVTTQWIPFYVLYLVKTVREPEAKNAVLAGLFAALSLLAEMIFGVFLGILTLVYLLVEGIRYPRPALTRLALRLGLLAATAAVIWGPVGVPVLREMVQSDYALQGWGESVKLSADLAGLVTPTALHPLWGEDWAGGLRTVIEGTARFSDVNTVFLGYATLALALLGLLAYRRRVAAWGWSAFLFVIFSLGPLLQINGRNRFNLDGLEVTVPLPFILLHYLPIVRANRAPNRFSVVLMLALAVLAGYGVYYLLTRRFSRAQRFMVPGLSVFLAAAVLFEHGAWPPPLTDARMPRIYQQIAQEEGDFAILQLPLGWRNSFGTLGAEDTRVQYYQTVHGRPMLGGNISRNPPIKMDYFAHLPLFQALTAVEMYREPDAATDAAARAQAAELLALYQVRYVVMLPPVSGRVPYADTWARTQEYARQVLPLEAEPTYEADGVSAYRVLWPAATANIRIDFGTEAARAHQGEGWDAPEEIYGVSATWAAAREARILLSLREPGAYRLTLRAAPFAYPGGPRQTVQVLLNGHPLGPAQAMNEGYQEYTFNLPPERARAGLNVVTLRFGYAARPRDVLPADLSIGRTGVRAPVDVEVDAAPDHAYISAYDAAGRKTDASAGRRGYNLAVLDPRSGRVLEMKGFDTWANEYEAQRLADFVAAIPLGRIVVAATKDDATPHLTEAAVRSLADLGASVDLRGQKGRSHALVGVKGAPPGTALEWSGAGNSYLRVGRNADRRPLAAAVDWLAVERGQ